MSKIEGSTPQIYNHLDLPSFGLRRYDGETYKAAVRPLTRLEIVQGIANMVDHNPDRLSFSDWLQGENKKILRATKTVAIVLDGRDRSSAQGFLGDMIEATRLVNVLRSTGKAVTIVTPHLDVFQGNADPAIKVLPIPNEVPASPMPTWRQELLRHLHNQVGETPVVFPLNAAIPAFIQIGPNGVIQNIEHIRLAKEAFEPQTNKLVPSVNWGRFGVHQLQAFQLTAHLLGIEGVENWQNFPPAFLHPTREAEHTAKEVIRIYGCFGSRSSKCPPAFLHPGVAASPSKLTKKFYPEQDWQLVLNQLPQADPRPGSITFIEPTDPDQAAMTLRLATTAVEAGLRVAKVPMASIKKRYEWTLGSFIAFLGELSKHKGVIMGCDSMPAGHAGPATGNPAIVLGSHYFDPGFYCPPERALVVLPPVGYFHTSKIEPERVVQAAQYLCKDPQLQGVVGRV